jgi:hypothetical protein
MIYLISKPVAKSAGGLVLGLPLSPGTSEVWMLGLAVAQVVEQPPTRHKALSSTPSTSKKKKEKKKKR